jgi:Icc-related predicted phosphoesterase
MTHFPPILQSEHPKYAGDPYNPYFVNDLPDLVRELKPKLWVHGHTHSAFDYEFEGVRVVCNPIGYPGENIKEPIFMPKIVEIAVD